MKPALKTIALIATLGAIIIVAAEVFRVVVNEVKKAVWAQSHIRIQEPTQRLLMEIQNNLNAGKTNEAQALLSHMTTNWHQIHVAPWMKSVDDVRAEFQPQGKQKSSEQKPESYFK